MLRFLADTLFVLSGLMSLYAILLMGMARSQPVPEDENKISYLLKMVVLAIPVFLLIPTVFMTVQREGVINPGILIFGLIVLGFAWLTSLGIAEARRLNRKELPVVRPPLWWFGWACTVSLCSGVTLIVALLISVNARGAAP